MILVGTSCDDIFVIVLFSTFVTMAQGSTAHIMDFAYLFQLFLAYCFGVLLVLGCMFSLKYHLKKHKIKSSTKVIIILAAAFSLMTIETWVKDYIAISGLFAVAAISSVPLSLGLQCGKIILSVAVLAIIITAPFGALGIDSSYKKLLQDNA